VSRSGGSLQGQGLAVTWNTPVAVVTLPHAETSSLLDAVLDASEFWAALRTRALECERDAAALRIAIKPDLDVFDATAATGTDPALVETLIALLRTNGYDSVVVCDGRNQPDSWLHNRGPLCVPDLIGYRFEAEGVPYAVESAEDEAVLVRRSEHDESTALLVCAAWMNADFRITMGKSKTDDGLAYSLCVNNLLGLIPPSAGAASWPAEDRCVHLLRHAAPHFALLDAIVSSHGSCGSRHAEPVGTATLLASTSAVLVDWIAALKMGVDPYSSPVARAALRTIGLPRGWTLHGDAAPWPAWKNPHPVQLQNVRCRGEWEELDVLVRAILQPVDREHFPFKDPVLDQINATVTARLAGIADERLRRGIEMLLQQLLALAASSRRAYACTVDKSAIARVDAPVTFDVGHVAGAAFDETADLVDNYMRVLTGAVPNLRGLRLRTIDGDVHFSASTTLPFAFAEFVERVAIARAIQYMNDYVGGEAVVAARDTRGRVTRQAERNVYLPQPNWTSLVGGQPIDVEKLECLSYDDRQGTQTISWQTVHSANRSAQADDGRVTFARNGDDAVDVHVYARQRFGQPPAVAAAHVERFPAVYGELLTDAYTRFFRGTVANLEAAYAGRPYRIGHDRDPAAFDGMMARRGLGALLAAAAALIAKLTGNPEGADGESGAASAVGARVFSLESDDLGFRHFAGTAGGRFVLPMSDSGGSASEEDPLTARVFLMELGQALVRDVSGFASGQMAERGA
jgi:uncharacterized protein (DUF362 family)